MRVGSTRLLLVALALAGTSIPLQGIAAPENKIQGDGSVDRIFRQWLDTFNSGEPAKIKAFYATYLNNPNPVFAIESAKDTCGLAVDKIVARSATTLTVLLRQKCLPGLQRLKLELEEPGASKLKALSLNPLPLRGDGAITATTTIALRQGGTRRSTRQIPA